MRAGPLLLAALLVLGCGPSGGGEAPERSRSADAAEPAERRSATTAAGGQEAADSVRETDAAEDAGTLEVRVAGIPVTVEVADQEPERNRGLMGRDSLPEDHGMLFVYPEEGERSFWMRNTRIPLDIAFLDRHGTIVDIQGMDPQSEELHTSRQPAMYALEMNRGWFRERGVEVGDRVEF